MPQDMAGILQRAATRRGQLREEGSYEKETSRRKHKQDCHDRAGILKRTATRRKPVERSIRRLPRQGRHAAESSYEKEASRTKHKKTAKTGQACCRKQLREGSQ